MSERGSLEFLCDISQAVIQSLEAVGKEHQCIDGSALLVKVLHKLGYPEAHPMTVRVRILNRRLVEWIKSHVAASAADGLLTCDDERAIEIRVGDESLGSRDQWGGHMAVVIPQYFPDRHALLDITIGQANRPDFGVVLPPVGLPVDDPFLIGRRPHALRNLNGCNLFYTAFPKDRSYGDWDELIKNPWINQTSEDIVRRLQDARHILPFEPRQFSGILSSPPFYDRKKIA